MNKIYISLPMIFILNMSGCATVAQSAPLYEKYESQNLKCGEANVKVISYCYDPEKGLEDRGSGGIVRECKSSVIKINNTQEINIPVMAENQKKLLEKQGYDFSGKLEEGKWSLVSFACIKNNQDSFLNSYIKSILSRKKQIHLTMKLLLLKLKVRAVELKYYQSRLLLRH